MLFVSMTLLRAMNASGAGAGRHGWAPMNSANLYSDADGGVCVCSRTLVCAYVGMRDVFAIYDNKI